VVYGVRSICPLIIVLVFLVMVVLRQPLPEAHFVDPEVEEEEEEGSKGAKGGKGSVSEGKRDVEQAQVCVCVCARARVCVCGWVRVCCACSGALGLKRGPPPGVAARELSEPGLEPHSRLCFSRDFYS